QTKSPATGTGLHSSCLQWVSGFAGRRPADRLAGHPAAADRASAVRVSAGRHLVAGHPVAAGLASGLDSDFDSSWIPPTLFALARRLASRLSGHQNNVS